ncbi:multiple PDZ domain protein [Brachyhypopomus gauderio]|uniref:multiple PDZ domain protein n=1 Tax=Brachyhypopomus gauderio TaxID=698409 RepID=UPI004041CDDB
MHRAVGIRSKQETNADRAATTTIQLQMDHADAAQSRQPPDTALGKLRHVSQPTKTDGGRMSRISWRDQEMEGAVRQTPWGRGHDGAGHLGKGGVTPDRMGSQQASRPRGAAEDLGNKNMEQALQQKRGEQQAQSRVTLIRRNGESLGISITGGRGMGSRLSNGEVRRGIFIKHIADDSPAARNNMLKVGDRILQVGGVDVSASTHEEVVEAIRQAGVKVQLLVQHQQASITRHEEHLSQEHHHNRLESDSQNSPILPICPAYPTTPIPFKPTERLLRKPPQAVLPPLRLPSGPVGTVTDGVTTKNVFERQSEPLETTQHSEQEQASYWSHMLERYGSLPGDLKMVELDCEAHSSGLGVCVTGSRDTTHGRMRVYVSEVQPDGAAAADGRIRAGDELLEINGQILYGRSHQNAASIISNAQSKAMIVLMRNKMELRHMATGPVLETESSPIVSPSAVGIIMFKEDKHDTLLNQEGKARLEDTHRAYSSEKSSINRHISSSNHKPPSDPVPTFYSSLSSQISPSFSNPPISHNTAANHTQTIHPTSALCSPSANHSGIGVPSSSYCPSCSRSPDLLTHPIIPGCLNTIDICKGMSGLGLTIVGGCNTILGAIMIQEVHDGGAAHSDGRLMAGDHILEVNGIDLRMATNQEALSILRLSPHLVRLCVYRQPWTHCTHTFKNPAPYVQEDMWDLFTVDLQIGPRQSLGLSVVGKSNDTGIFVSEIMKGGAVEFDGRLLPGDQILSVNGEDIRAVTQDYATTLLQNCRGSVALEMARFKANPHYSYQVGDSHASPLPSVNIYDALDRNRDARTVTLEKGVALKDGHLRPAISCWQRMGGACRGSRTQTP